MLRFWAETHLKEKARAGLAEIVKCSSDLKMACNPRSLLWSNGCSLKESCIEWTWTWMVRPCTEVLLSHLLVLPHRKQAISLKAEVDLMVLIAGSCQLTTFFAAGQ